MALVSETDFHEEMQAIVREVHYDFAAQTGDILLVEGGCVDMIGTIAFFSRIDPNVQAIFTTDGIERGTSYFRNGRDTWAAG